MQPSDPFLLNLDSVFQKILNFFAIGAKGIFSADFLYGLRAVVTLIVILLIAGIIYILVRLYEIREEDKKTAAAMKRATAAIGVGGIAAVSVGNPVWERIRAKLLSESQSEWRLAIIEADIYMDRMLEDYGFHGETVGDKLKALTTLQLPSLQSAWEAHKVRNTIAHEGSEYVLTLPEVRRTLAQFEAVFRDLGVIV